MSKAMMLLVLTSLILVMGFGFRPAAAADAPLTLDTSERWFTNPISGIAAIDLADGLWTVTQKGTVHYKNALVLEELAFDIRFSNVHFDGQLATIQFIKQRRESFFGEPHTDRAENRSYGLTFDRNGTVALVKFGIATEKKILASGRVDIDDGRFLSVELRLRNEGAQKVVLEVVLDGNTGHTMRAVDDQPGDLISLKGFFSITNDQIAMKTVLRNVAITGSEEPTDLRQTPLPVYFLDYFEEDGQRFIHWRYNDRCQNYIGAQISTPAGAVVARVDYPADRWVIPPDVGTSDLVVQTINIDGHFSDKRSIYLRDTTSHLFAQKTERIAVVAGEPYAQFIHAESGKPFQVRGVNYVRLAFGGHCNFQPKTDMLPQMYDPYDTESVLRTCKRYGYNTVRIFLIGRKDSNAGIAGYHDFDGPVYPPYLDHLADFVRRAHKYGVYVLPTFGDGEYPMNVYYDPIRARLEKITGETIKPGQEHNAVYLTTEGITARQELIVQTVNHIKNADPKLLDALLCVQLQNELSLRATEWPFTLDTGSVTTANGKTYDMADDDARQRLMDEGYVHYHNEMVRAIKRVAPNLLVGEGCFTLRIVGKDRDKNYGVHMADATDARYPPTAVTLARSNLDFMDIHIYHVFKHDTALSGYRDDMASMLFYTDEMARFRRAKPVIMGEFGAFTFMADDFSQAARNILLTRDAALADGLNGFMIWTLDTFEQQRLYHALDGGEAFLAEFNDLYLGHVH